LVFAFQVLPIIIFIAAFFAILYYYGVMQFIIKQLAKVMMRLMGASGVESLSVAASIFMGITEAPLTIRPFLPKVTRSELMTIMTSGMAMSPAQCWAPTFCWASRHDICWER
jgi:CNT family concentrative nucleoside transporter